MKNYFLEVKTHSKAAFLLISCFVVIQLILTWKQIEITPFLHWAMYSQKASPGPYEIFTIKLNDRKFNLQELNDLERESITSPLRYYGKLIESSFKDPWERFYSEYLPVSFNRKLINHPEFKEEFQDWFKERLSTYCNCSVEKVEILKLECRYENGIPYIISQKTMELF